MAAFDLTLEAKPASVRRLQVLSGDLGRRRWPDEVKARIVGESPGPGAVVSWARWSLIPPLSPELPPYPLNNARSDKNRARPRVTEDEAIGACSESSKSTIAHETRRKRS